jgi:hypothetical protein
MVNTHIERKVDVKKHVLALIITALIFTVGILIGSGLSEERIKFMTENIEEQRIEYESLQMQLLYLTGQEEKNCEVLLKSLERNIYDLENSRVKLENYIAGDEDASFSLVKRDYMLTEIRYWLLAKEVEEVCPNDAVNVLFFYEMDEVCGDCSAQGYILTYLKDIFGENFLVFSLDVGFDEPMIQILKEGYGVDELPAIVFGNEVFNGLVEKEELIQEFCDKHQDSSNYGVCEEY